MEQASKVSILIPVYNREKIIGETLHSAISQTYENIEIIVVDNASTDGTWDVCKSFASKDARIKVYRNETNIGPVRNWKRCIDEACGNYGKILFSDDTIDSEYLKKTVPFLQDSDVGFVFSAVVVGSKVREGEIKYKFAKQSGKYSSERFIKEALFSGNVSVSPGCAVFRLEDLRKNLMDNIPSPTISDFSNHGAGPDILLYLLTAKAYQKIGYVCDPLCFFRHHDESISISKRGAYLRRCYRQAKIWFAENNLDEYALRSYYAFAWIQECKINKSFNLPSEVLASVTHKKTKISLQDIAIAFASKYIKGLKIVDYRGKFK